MTFNKIWIIPVLSTVFAFAAFFISYIVAVANDHVQAFLPFISDGGTMAPESCIFAELLNFAALFSGITAFLRHRQIVEFYEHRLQQTGKYWRRASLILLWTAYIGSVGTTLVANFQETRVRWVHAIGALLTFKFNLIYCWGQIYFSYRMRPPMIADRITHLRAVLIAFVTVFMIFHEVTNYLKPFVPYVNGVKLVEAEDDTTVHKYEPESPFYKNHLIGTISEWLMAIGFQLFQLSLAIEFRHAYAHAPQLQLHTTFAASATATVGLMQNTMISAGGDTRPVAEHLQTKNVDIRINNLK